MPRTDVDYLYYYQNWVEVLTLHRTGKRGKASFFEWSNNQTSFAIKSNVIINPIQNNCLFLKPIKENKCTNIQTNHAKNH
jgi:hypothetical protein